MTGRAAAIVLALALNPVPLHGQDLVFTVSVSSADVHKGPSIVTPVIGHVARGTATPVLRNLGSWVKVQWPGGPDGFGYLHVTTGQLSVQNGNASTKRGTSSTATPAPGVEATVLPVSTATSASVSSSPTMQTTKPPRPTRERVVIRQQGSTPISHVVGIGGMFGSMSSFGVTSRAWRDNGLGLQIGFTRDETTSSTAPGRVTSMQLEPAVVYGLFDRVGDYFWIKPYVGGGLSIRHQNLQDAPAAAGATTSSTGAGYRVFGGSEVTFAGAPRFALSVDVGYRHVPTPFAGFEADRFAVTGAGHWYVK